MERVRCLRRIRLLVGWQRRRVGWRPAGGEEALVIVQVGGHISRTNRIHFDIRLSQLVGKEDGDGIDGCLRRAVGREHPWLMREMFSGSTVEQEAFPDLHVASKAVFTLSMEVVKRGQERGKIIDGDPGALTGVLWSLLHGVAMLTIENQMRPYTGGPEVQRAYHLVVRMNVRVDLRAIRS